MKKLLFALALGFFGLLEKGSAQMVVAPGDTLFGNEWIRFGQPYLKIQLAEDGIYRISAQALADAGWPIGQINGQNLQLFCLGNEQRLRVSTAGPLAATDFLEFVGERNRAGIDQFLFADRATILNPEYSLFNDTAAYFLTHSPTAAGLRFQEISNDLSGALPTAEGWVWGETVQFFNDGFVKERLAENGLTNSFFGNEGWSTGFQKMIEKGVPAPQLAASAGQNMELRLRFAEDIYSHKLNFLINGQVVDTLESEGFRLYEKLFSVDPSAATGGQVTFKIQNLLPPIPGTTTDFDKTALAMARLRYPRLLNFDGQNAAAFSAKSGEQLLEIAAFSGQSGGGEPVFFDLKNGQRLVGKVENGLVRAHFPASQNERLLCLVNSAEAVKTVQKIKPVLFENLAAANVDYLIIANRTLAADASNPGDVLDEYAAYRASSAGGGHSARVFDVENLYDQFAYGLSRHPIAVSNFGQFALKNWTKKPRFALLVGKPWDHRRVRKPAQFATTLNTFFFLPSYGGPISDHLFFAGAAGARPVSQIEVGRLAAISATEVKTYLEKIKSHELEQRTAPQTLADRDWTKHVLQLSGGDPSIQNSIRGYMREFEHLLTPSRLGAEVSTFTKNAAIPVQTSVGEAVEARIRNGTAIYNVFGHSSSFGFDFYLDNPEQYGNAGRLPLMLGFGCFSGDCAANTINSSFRSLGERMILGSASGSIGYYATSGYGYLDQLRDFGNIYFRQIGDVQFGQSVQKSFNESAKIMAQFQNQGADVLLQQLLYQGDPALRLTVAEGPDYLFDLEKVKVDPMAVPIEKDSFDLEFEIANLGENRRDTVAFRVYIVGPGGAMMDLKTGKAVCDAYRKKVKLKIPTPTGDPQKWLGVSRLLIELDPAQKIAEWPAPAAEANNRLVGADGADGMPIFFFSNDVLPISPADFGIVSKSEIRLTATTLNLLEPSQRIFWQIDTSAKFDSPLFRAHETTQAGGILNWQPTIPALDSTVYFWRISRDTVAGIGFVWHESSFIVLKNQPKGGWNQSVFHQFDENAFEKMEAVDSTRRLEFERFQFEMRFRLGTREATAPIFWYQQGNVVNNFTNTNGFNPSRGDALLLTYHPVTGTLVDGKKPNGAAYENAVTYVLFRTETEPQRRAMFDYLRDSVGDGLYTILLTCQDTLGNDWNPELFGADSTAWGGQSLLHLLESAGAKSLRDIAADSVPRPWAMVYRKNFPAYKAVELVGQLPVAPDFFVPLWLRMTEGSFKTPKIGPAKKWDRLEWRLDSLDSAFETARVDVFGIRSDGSEDLLLADVAAGDTLLNGLDAAKHPFLRLAFRATDSEKRTVAPIERLRVLFDGLPEGSIDPAAGFFFEKDSLAQGEPLRVAATFRHLDGPGMDSVLVKFTAQSASNQLFSIQKREKALPEGDSIRFEATLDTRQMGGPMNFLMTANPDGDQPERLLLNNVWTRPFFVEKDATNPLLDVRFDGERLVDGDLVSPKPEIFISLKDENRWLAMADPTTLTIKIIEPDSTERLFLLDGSDPAAEFFPADQTNLGKKNEAKARLRPVFEKDGLHELIVSGRDASGNESGALDYRARFEVQTRSAISTMLNYPNPFSTSTCFVYTLTGLEMPKHFRLQIMTISGKIVREVDEHEFGPLRPGRHVSDFCWDGRDSYGDQLANGVYLYRILTAKADGSAFEKILNEKADAFFGPGGWGKMVLIR